MIEITIETFMLLTMSGVLLVLWLWGWLEAARSGALVLLDYAEHNDLGRLAEDAVDPISAGAVGALAGYIAIYHLWPLEGLHMLIFGA